MSDRRRIEAACRASDAEGLLALATEAAFRLDVPSVHRAMLLLSRVASVEMSRKHPTAWISRIGGDLRLRFHPEFFLKNHETGEEVLHTVLHELLHVVQGDFARFRWARGADPEFLENFTCDLFVNRELWRSVFRRGLPYFGKIYPKDRFPANLLLPPDLLLGTDPEARSPEEFLSAVRDALGRSGIRGDRLDQAAALYRDLWKGDVSQAGIRERLRECVSPAEDVLFLGVHRHDWDLASLVKRLVGDPLGKAAGFSEDLRRERTRPVPAEAAAFAEAVRAALAPDPRRPREALRLLPDRGVVPFPGRREAFLLSAGLPPAFYPVPLHRTGEQETRVHLYLDVSASTEEHRPFLYGLILHLRPELSEPFHLFSNRVRDASFADLERGRVETTGGTDFDCVAEHALRSFHRKILVVTDGHASLDPALARRLRAEGVEVHVVLTEKPRRRHGLATVAKNSWVLPDRRGMG